jgi:hypothetical protein
MAQQPLVGQGLLKIEASQSHSDTSHSVGLLWTSDQPNAETSTCTSHNIHKRQTSMPGGGFEPAIPAGKQPQTHALDWRWLGWVNPGHTEYKSEVLLFDHNIQW